MRICDFFPTEFDNFAELERMANIYVQTVHMLRQGTVFPSFWRINRILQNALSSCSNSHARRLYTRPSHLAKERGLHPLRTVPRKTHTEKKRNYEIAKDTVVGKRK